MQDIGFCSPSVLFNKSLEFVTEQLPLVNLPSFSPL